MLQTETDIRKWNSRLVSAVLWAGTATLLVACSVLTGWLFDIPLLKSINPSFVAMKANTAFGFLFASLALLFLGREKLSGRQNQIVVFFSVVVLLIGLITSLEYIFHVDLGIDQIIFSEKVNAVSTSSPGRMAPNTAVIFALLGFVLLNLRTKNTIFRVILQFVLVIVLLLTLFTLLGYIYGHSTYMQFSGFTKMAIHTSVTFFILTLGILFAVPNEGILLFFRGKAAGVVVMRRLLFAVLFLPVIIGWLRYEGEMAGYFSNMTGKILLVVSMTFALFVVILFAALSVYESEQKRHLALIELKKLSLAVNQSPSYVIITDVNGTIEYVNAKFTQSTGFTAEEVLGKNPRILKSGDNSEAIYKEMWETIRSGKEWSGELKNKRKDGSAYWEQILIAPVLNTDGEISHFVSMNQDISYQKQAEAELARYHTDLELMVKRRTEQLEIANATLVKSEERFRSTLDHMLEGCQIIGFDWRYLYLNIAAVAQSQFPAEKLLGNIFTEVWPEIESTPLYAMMKKCLEERVAEYIENQFFFPNGNVGWFELRIQPVPEGIFILSQDITDRKQHELQIQKMNTLLEKHVEERTAQLALANKELEAFSYSVSHDLRSPLRHINGFIELLQKHQNGSFDDKSLHFLDVIASSARQMGHLIDDLLQFSRMGRAALKYERVDLDDLTQNIIQELILSSGAAKIDWMVKPLPPVYADRTLLKVVLGNLIGNAIKYSSKTTLPRIEVGAGENDDELIFYVKDNGAGFNMAYVNKLFGVFQRLHSENEYEGTGIGLATVRRIISKHGGRTWAEGEVDKGATFSFSLPKRNGSEPTNDNATNNSLMMEEHNGTS